MTRMLLTLLGWGLASLGYFVLGHVMDREGITGTLLASHPTFQHVAALLALMALRVATVLVLPAVTFALLVEALLARVLRGSAKKPVPDQSIIEPSQVGSSEQQG